ncbi:MAG: hypothetical protein ACFFC7_18915 [Candidatus Hermodarchaeota archaeon]
MPLPEVLCSIKPQDLDWRARVEIELKILREYAAKSKPSWFVLQPDKNFNFQKWDGYLVKKQQLNTSRNIHILLSSFYPEVAPQCFIERIHNTKINKSNFWLENNQKFFRIDLHIGQEQTWDPVSMGICDYLTGWLLPWWNKEYTVNNQNEKHLTKNWLICPYCGFIQLESRKPFNKFQTCYACNNTW